MGMEVCWETGVHNSSSMQHGDNNVLTRNHVHLSPNPGCALSPATPTAQCPSRAGPYLGVSQHIAVVCTNNVQEAAQQVHLCGSGCQLQHHLQLGWQVLHQDLWPSALDERLAAQQAGDGVCIEQLELDSQQACGTCRKP